jgi:hypothetical protein
VLKAAYKSLDLDESGLDQLASEEEPQESQRAEAKGDLDATKDSEEDVVEENVSANKSDSIGDQKMSVSKEVLARIAQAAVTAYANEMKATLSPEELTSVVDGAVADLTKSVTETSDQDEAIKAATTEEFTKSIKELVDRVTGLENDKIASAIKANLANAKPASKAGGAFSAGISNMIDRRLDGLSAEDLVFGAQIMYKAMNTGLRRNGPSEEWMKATASKVMKLADQEGSTYSEDSYEIKSALGAGSTFKADEVFASNLANNGQAFVGVTYDNQLWYKVRESPIYQQVLAKGLFDVTIPQGSNSIYIPTEGSDPTWYNLVELNDLDATERLPVLVPMSNPQVSRRQITPGMMGARTSFTDIENEDSIIPVLPFQRYLMERSFQEQFEYVLFNGDTATGANTNINLIDGTPSVDSKGRGPVYLLTDGFLKLPLVTTTAQSRDGGVFDETDFLATLKLLPTAQQVAYDRMVFIVDPATYLAAMNITAFKTKDVFSAATLESGILRSVYGIDVIRSGQLGLANTAGKISATPANNAFGRILLIRPDQWAIARKRNIQTEVARDIDAQATVVVSTMRWGMTYRSATGSAAVTYDLSV